MTDLAVIGGGASGLMAAITFKKLCPKSTVTVFERLDRVGKKLATTGNGRCNITNSHIDVENYHGAEKEFCRKALEEFDLKSTQDFFGQLGVVFKTEQSGKIYPYSLQASSVVDALRFCTEKLKINTVTNTEITEICKSGKMFCLKNGNEKETARCVIVCAGGKAGGKIATDCGYTLLQSLHHTLKPLSPAIVQVKTENEYTKQLKGVKVNANVTVANGKGQKVEFGEVLFCDYGLSGPPILQLSRYMENGTDILLDIMPEYSLNQVKNLILMRANALNNRSYGEFFCGMLHKRIGQIVLKINGFSINDNVKLSENDVEKISNTIKNMKFKYIDRGGFQNAQVTHGGISTNEFFSDSMMSKKHRGLFACGEVLDIDGDCGGYNLQWAWSSGYIAGKGAAQIITEES